MSVQIVLSFLCFIEKETLLLLHSTGSFQEKNELNQARSYQFPKYLTHDTGRSTASLKQHN